MCATRGGELSEKLARRIRNEGPLTVAAFMATALHDPEFGYYARRSPIGRAGDFITAPEISQVFGELIGLWCADLWQRMGRPDPVLLVELGPGRGVLMQDLLRAAASVPGFRAALRLYMVEISPLMRAEQQRLLGNGAAHFADNLDQVPPGPVLVVANEFLDALPIRQFVRGRTGWSERMVGLDENGRLAFADGPVSPMFSLLVPAPLREAPSGTIVEICPGATAIAGALAARLTRDRGAALLIDYGYFPTEAAATFAAIAGHRRADPLAAPGEADLSAHVDFAAVAETARQAGAAVYGPVGQGGFLAALGADARHARLSADATPGQRAALESGLARLIDPGQMGTLFKVLAMTSPGLPMPAGFAA